jgi:hypothetical protein
MTEARLHEGAGRSVERLARRAQDFVDYLGHFGIVPGSEFRVPTLALQPFLAALFAFADRTGRATAGAFALKRHTIRDKGSTALT